MYIDDWFVILGVLLGNWLVVPIFFKRTFKEGFILGVLAAVICTVLFLLARSV